MWWIVYAVVAVLTALAISHYAIKMFNDEGDFDGEHPAVVGMMCMAAVLVGCGIGFFWPLFGIAWVIGTFVRKVVQH